MLAVKRVYEAKSEGDGYRVLVDRLWPRGESKEKAGIDLWLKAIAPSNELRRWFGHDPEKWNEFRKRYCEELAKNRGAVEQLRAVMRDHKKVTLVYGARDEDHNQAVALREFMASK